MNVGRGERIYFTHKELACPKTGLVKLDPRFEVALLELRISYARPMRVNSCCRSMAYNKDIGGHPRSLHVYDFSHHGLDGTAAIDIAWPAKPADRVDMLFAALEMGWSAGVAKWGVHLDRRDTAGLPQAIFGY